MQRTSIWLLVLSAQLSLPLQASTTLPINTPPLPTIAAPTIEPAHTPESGQMMPALPELSSPDMGSAVTEAAATTQPGLRLMPSLPNMIELQQLLPNWALLDEFGRALLPVTEDLLTDIEKKALNLARCRFLNAQHAALDYGLLEPRQTSATTAINVHVICPLGQSFGLIPVQNNQPVDAYQIPPERPDQPSMKITLLDISGRPIQDMQYSGTGRVETLQLIGLLQPSDGESKLPAGEVRLPTNSNVLIKLP
jgi:hypothetical protein